MKNLLNIQNQYGISILCILLFIHCEVCFSQTKELYPVHYKGCVVASSTNEPLPSATITLHTSDGILLAGAISEKNGCFDIEWQGKSKSQTDSLILHCSFMGYAAKSIKVPTAYSHNVGVISLDETQQILDEITVTAQRSPFKFEHGTYLANVSGTALSQLSSANDVLKRLPLIAGDNGSFTVRGRGQAIIFINRREVRDPSEIQNIDASQIESVRIITDPGVSYPIGTKAVIELTIKQWYKDHLGITFESELYQRQRLSQYYTLRTNYTKKKFSLMALLKMADPKFDPKTDINYKISRPGGDLSYNVMGTSKQNNLKFSFDTGLNYDINDKHSLGYYISASLSPRQISSHKDVYSQNGIQKGNHTTDVESERHGINGSFYYVGKTRTLDINFQNYFFHALKKGTQSLTLDQDGYFNMDNMSESFLYDAKLELGNKGMGGYMSYGVQSTYTRRKDESSVHEGEVNSSNSLSVQYLLSPFFSYNWAYKKLSVLAGLRVEWEKRQFPNHNTSDTENFFYNPKVSVNYKFSNSLSTSFNWQTFTSRPQYFVLSGISSMVYPFLYNSGNAHLKSTQNNNFYLNISYKKLIVQLKAKHIKNGISVYYSFDNPSQRINKTFLNTPPHWEYGMATIYQFKPLKVWTIDVFGELGYGSFDFGYSPKRNYFKRPSFLIDVNNIFNLSNGYTFDFYMGYSKTINGIEESLGKGGISGSINKFFFDRKLYISFNIGQYIQKKEVMRTIVDNIQVDQLWDTSNKYVGLTLKYKFNTVPEKNKASVGNSSEIRRF